MYQELTEHDYKLAKEYIILRCALKVLKHDKEAMKYKGTLKLSGAFTKLVEDAQGKINKRLEQLRKYLIRVAVVDVAGVYEVKVENRKGNLLLNATEIMLEIEKLILSK